MVLEAKLFEKQQSLNPVKESSVAPKSEKFGDVKKCPACGAIVESFQSKCVDCGLEFRSGTVASSAQKLFDLLQSIAIKHTEENKILLENFQKQSDAIQKNIPKRTAIGSFFMGKKDATIAEKQINALNEQLGNQLKSLDEKMLNEKTNTIKNFPIPNTKDDLLELLTMASSNAYDNDGSIGKEEECWLQKTDQIYSKIKIVAANSQDFNLLKTSTTIILSLISRLPLEYKKFTEIPKDMKKFFDKEMKLEIISKHGKFIGNIVYFFKKRNISSNEKKIKNSIEKKQGISNDNKNNTTVINNNYYSNDNSNDNSNDINLADLEFISRLMTTDKNHKK